jgi:predicted histidine transporter YuiF (NhaC family)
MTHDIEEKKSNYFIIPKEIKSQKNTPLYHKIELDQIKIASIAAFIRTTYREIVNTDILISELSNILSKKIVIIPSEILIISMFTGFTIIYNKTNEAEEKRIERLYKLYNNQKYYEKYIKMRRISMVLLIIITCLTTRNVQPVE